MFVFRFLRLSVVGRLGGWLDFFLVDSFHEIDEQETNCEKVDGGG